MDPLVSRTQSSYGYGANDPLDESDPSGQFGLGILGAAIGGAVGAISGGVTYLAGCGNNCSLSGAAGATVGGAVGGAITGACDGETFEVAACGAVGGAAGSIVNNVVSGNPISMTDALEASAFGAAGGALTNKIVPMRGFKPYKLNNLLNPGPNTVRMWQDAIWGAAFVGSAQAWFDSCPPNPATN